MIRSRFPILIALAVFAALVALYWLRVLALTHGHLTYALDDAYIHLAVAKNLVLHHVWGVSPDRWSGVSSSLLWTVLVSLLFVIFGTNEFIPFILNILFALALLWLLDRIWVRIGLPSLQRLALLVLTFVALPLASQPFIGMEVTLQCLLLVVFYYTMSWTRSARDGNDTTSASLAICFIAAFLLGAIRYETVLIVELVAIGVLLRQDVKRALVIGIAGALPATIYGVAAVAYGGTFVPNTLFLKARGVQIIGDRIVALGWLVSLIALLVIVVVYYAYRIFRKRFPHVRPSLEAIVITTTVVTALAQGGLSTAPQQFERYRSYLFLSMVLCVGLVLRRFSGLAHNEARRIIWIPKPIYRLIPILLIVAITVAFLPKFLFYIEKTPIACKNIYDEQVQEARFVRMYCEGKPVVLVDIGAVTFYANSPITDLIGLGSDDIARILLRNPHDTTALNRVVRERNARLAILYPILDYKPDSNWVMKGKLIIDSNYVCARDTVQFWALRAEDTSWLGASLRDFRGKTTSEILTW